MGYISNFQTDFDELRFDSVDAQRDIHRFWELLGKYAAFGGFAGT
jgi:hypothetical protein